jgi:GDP-L-fucose synthase
MVIPSLIRKAQENDVLEVWGDGSAVRDFIHADDVAMGMIFAVENKITEPINLGSGEGYSIKEVVDMVVKHCNKDIEVKWLTDKPSGDALRLFDMTRANSYGFNTSVDLDKGIKQTTDWFVNNKSIIDKRYNAFVDH